MQETWLPQIFPPLGDEPRLERRVPVVPNSLPTNPPQPPGDEGNSQVGSAKPDSRFPPAAIQSSIPDEVGVNQGVAD